MAMHSVEIYRPYDIGGDNPEINVIPPGEASKLDGGILSQRR